MGITSSMITALSGLSANSSQLDVVGNNIANVNTVGFKSSRLDFKTQFSETFSYGSGPSGDLGGTNPIQVGLGVTNGAVTRDFNNGSIQVTGQENNLAIQGDGFFIVKGATQAYTRDGSFQLNAQNQLVNSSGMMVQGFGVDSNNNIVPGTLQNITVPIGAVTALATTNIPITGTLDASGDLPTQVSSLTMNEPFYESDGAGGVTGTAPTAATPLSMLADASGNLYFSPTDVINLQGSVGNTQTGLESLAVTPTSGPPSTLGDLMSFFTGTLGINTSAGANGSIATTPGASLVAGAPGSVQLSIAGNPGVGNDITLTSSSVSVPGASSVNPFTWNKTATADGNSITTQATAYDTLGTPLTTNIVVSLLNKSNSGTTWQFYATSPNGSGTGAATQAAVGTGTISFDTFGNYLGSTNPNVTIDRSNTGANPTLSFSLDFSTLSAKSGGGAALSANPTLGSGGGAPKGTLNSFTVEPSGIVKGKYSNGMQQNLGQIALATFRNNQGLVDTGSNLFEEGPNSGTAVISTPGELSAGNIVPHSLEQSNVDLSAQFVQLISASTGFSASSRVITTSNQLLQDLLSAAR